MATVTFFFIDQNSDFTVTKLLSDANGSPINLALYSTRTGTFAKSFDSENTYSFNCYTTNAASGNLTISLPAANSANIEPGYYNFNISLANSNVSIRVLEGRLTLNPSI